MACCLFAAFLIAQCVAAVRRWGMFWGVVQIPQGEQIETFVSTLRSFLSRKWLRAAVFGLLLAEASAVSGWIYFEHGQHIVELADIWWSRLHGRQVIYVGVCGKQGESQARLVFDMNASHVTK